MGSRRTMVMPLLLRPTLPILCVLAVLAVLAGEAPARAERSGRRRGSARSGATVRKAAKRRVVKRSSRRRGRRRGKTSRRKRRCRRYGDRLVGLKYLHGGGVWIPQEARCGGRFPVVVLLHGNNTSRERVKALGGGKRLDHWARRYLNGRHIQPVILAEPIHFGACARAEKRGGLGFLFTHPFSFAIYRKKLEALLAKRGIRPSSWSFIGHSGAACCLGTGMFALQKVWPEVRVWASADGCYSGGAQAKAVLRLFGGQKTHVFNACRGRAAYRGYRSYERTLLTAKAVPTRCDSRYYKRCLKHPSRPWYSYVTRFSGNHQHGLVLVELFKTVLFHEFPSARRLARLRRRPKPRPARRTRRASKARRPRPRPVARHNR